MAPRSVSRRLVYCVLRIASCGPLLLFGLAANLAAQGSQIRLTLAAVEADETAFVQDDAFPDVALEVVALNEYGVPVVGLDPAAFQLTENGVPVDAAVTPFASPERPVSILLVVDGSPPMREALPQLRAGALQLYDLLTQADESGVVVISAAGNAEAPPGQLSPTWDSPLTNDEGALINHLNALVPPAAGETPLYDTLGRAVTALSATARHERRAIILMTNGGDANAAGQEPGSSTLTNYDAIDVARRLGVPVYPIAWGAEADVIFLQNLAIFTGGSFLQADSAAGVGDFLAEVLAQLRHTYRLAYRSTLPADNAVHELVVSLPRDTAVAPLAVPLVARAPRRPQVTRLLLSALDGSSTPLNAADALRGDVLLTPEIQARAALASVSYYLDDAAAPFYVAAAPPWQLPWQTADLAPGQHTLRIVLQDTAEPPNVAETAVPLMIAACGLACRLQAYADPPFLLAGGLLILLALAVGVWLLRRPAAGETAVAAPVSGWPAVTGATGTFTGASVGAATPSTAETASGSHAPALPPQAAALPQAPAGPSAPTQPQADGTEVLHYDVIWMGFLIDPVTGRGYRLRAHAVVGSAAGCDVMIEDRTVAPRHAEIRLLNGAYVLDALDPVQVNGQPAARHLLQDGDQLRLGERQLVFKLVK